MSNNVLRVVSWNIKFGVEIDTAIEELRFIDEISSPGILLLQEMDEKGTAVIAEALDAGYVYTTLGPHAQTGREFGNAIVSRWPIGDVAEVLLPHQAWFKGHPRLVTRATISADFGPVLAYSVHTEIPILPLRRRRDQFDRIAADINQIGSDAVVVGGDFNTFTRRGVAAVRSSMGHAGLSHVSAGSGPSLPVWKFKLPADHIFASGFRTIRTGVAWSASASDHKPVWSEISPVS